MLAKAEIVSKIASVLRKRRLTRHQSASILRMSPSTFSSVLRGNFRDISIAQLERAFIRLEKPDCDAY